MERLQKIIANSGYCSRRKAEELIIKGKVKVNDEIADELGLKVKSSDRIEIDGNILSASEKEYILLYKPKGVVTTTSDDKKRKTVLDLIKTDRRVYPVGRLDYDTTGVLLLTNDGELTNLLIHPRNHVDKVYTVKIDAVANIRIIKQLENGIIIDGKKTAKAKIKIKKTDRKHKVTILQVTIHEGRNHQVKKMFEAVGYNVIKLKRDKFSFLDLEGLKEGEHRHLKIKEVKKLYNEINSFDE